MTGFALLFCGLVAALPSSREPLSSYHWYLIVCLAWFSAITHLAGLSVLRTYFDGRPWVKATRIVLMFLLLVALILALIPTGFFNWNNNYYFSAAAPQTPAICVFDPRAATALWHYERGQESDAYILDNEKGLFDTHAMQTMLFAVVLLVLGFSSRCIKLFRPLSVALRHGIRKPASGLFTSIFKKLADLPATQSQPIPSSASSDRHLSPLYKIWISAVLMPLFGGFLASRFLADLLSSMLAEVSHSIILNIISYDTESLIPYIYAGCSQRFSGGHSNSLTFARVPVLSPRQRGTDHSQRQAKNGHLAK